MRQSLRYWTMSIIVRRTFFAQPTMVDRTARKRRQTRAHIAATAHALFERDGYEAVTMEQIAAHADVARGTLYNHFPVKEAVLAHWMHAQLEADLGMLVADVLSRGSFHSRVATLLDASAQWWETHRHYAAPYIRFRFQQVRDADDGQHSSDMIPLYARLIADAQQAGELRQDASPDRLASYLHFLYLASVMTWLGMPGIPLAKEFSQALVFFVQGAGQATTPPGGKKHASRRS